MISRSASTPPPVRPPAATETYRVAEGRVIVVPRSIWPGPGTSARRLEGGQTFELPVEQLKHSFWKKRIRLGDAEKMQLAPSPSHENASAPRRDEP